MVRIRDTSHRLGLAVARQLTVSVTSSLVAATVMGGLHFGMTNPAPIAPERTSGGKFAARLDLPADAPALLPIVSLPTLAVVQGALPAPMPETRDTAVSQASARPMRTAHATRPEGRRPTQPIDAGVAPPKRADSVVAEEPEAVPLAATTFMAEAGGVATQMWSVTRGIVHRTIGLGDAIVAHVSPARLFD